MTKRNFYKGQCPDIGEFNSPIRDDTHKEKRKFILRCPRCDRKQCPLLRKKTLFVSEGRVWTHSGDHYTYIHAYVTECSCHQEFAFRLVYR